MASKITVGKIVPSAQDNGWSQAYHAGGFTAVISLSKKGEADEKTLQEHGKKLLDTLVSEYFTLTTKDLATVRDAVTATLGKTPSHTFVSLLVAAVVKNVLYVVIANEGRVLLKRGEKLGLLLEVKPEEEDLPAGRQEKVASVSGFLESGDIVLLHTFGFGKVFPHDDLVSAFDHRTTDELAEYFAPKVHESQDGTASALVFSFHDDEVAMPEPIPPQSREEAHSTSFGSTQDKSSGQEQPVTKEEVPAAELPGFEKPLPENKPKASFGHRQRLFLTIAVVLVLVLIGSVLLFQYRQQQARQKALFVSLYQPAKAKYDEASGVVNLNKALAIEDLQAAQTQLNDAKGKFPATSSEQKQILSLLNLVNQALDDAKKVPLLTASKAADNASPLLSFAGKHDGMYIAQDSSNFYTADNTFVTQYAKSGGKGQKIISADWKTTGGFSTYLGNMYVLDTKSGILKYVTVGDGTFGKNNYFSGTIPSEISSAVSIAIDSSIWILTPNSITKYTRGAQDTFSVSGMDTPFNNPTQIVTTIDLDNVYILDKGNSRVVVLKKDGSFVAQYASDTVRTTSLIDVSEKDKKIYLLSSGTVYQLDIK